MECWFADAFTGITAGLSLGSHDLPVYTNCGARRRFDLERWEIYGPYFFGARAANEQERERERRPMRGDGSNVYPILRAA